MTDILVAVICGILVVLFAVVMFEWKLIIRKRLVDIYLLEIQMLDDILLRLSEEYSKASKVEFVAEDYNGLMMQELNRYLAETKMLLPKPIVLLHLKKYLIKL